MATRKHVHSESFAAPCERVFALLHTPSAIRNWWSAARAIVLPAPGGIWAATWGEREDDPDYISAATLVVFEPPRCLAMANMKYHAKAGSLPFEANFQTEFTVAPHDDGCTLTVVQDGFPADPVADAFYAACEVGWENTFAGIRRYLHETV